MSENNDISDQGFKGHTAEGTVTASKTMRMGTMSEGEATALGHKQADDTISKARGAISSEVYDKEGNDAEEHDKYMRGVEGLEREGINKGALAMGLALKNKSDEEISQMMADLQAAGSLSKLDEYSTAKGSRKSGKFTHKDGFLDSASNEGEISYTDSKGQTHTMSRAKASELIADSKMHSMIGQGEGIANVTNGGKDMDIYAANAQYSEQSKQSTSAAKIRTQGGIDGAVAADVRDANLKATKQVAAQNAEIETAAKSAGITDPSAIENIKKELASAGGEFGKEAAKVLKELSNIASGTTSMKVAGDAKSVDWGQQTGLLDSHGQITADGLTAKGIEAAEKIAPLRQKMQNFSEENAKSIEDGLIVALAGDSIGLNTKEFQKQEAEAIKNGDQEKMKKFANAREVGHDILKDAGFYNADGSIKDGEDLAGWMASKSAGNKTGMHALAINGKTIGLSLGENGMRVAGVDSSETINNLSSYLHGQEYKSFIADMLSSDAFQNMDQERLKQIVNAKDTITKLIGKGVEPLSKFFQNEFHMDEGSADILAASVEGGGIVLSGAELASMYANRDKIRTDSQGNQLYKDRSGNSVRRDSDGRYFTTDENGVQHDYNRDAQGNAIYKDGQNNIVQRDSEGYFTTDKAGERQAYQGDINALRKPSADLKPVKGGGIIANFARRTLDGFKGQTSSEFSPKKSSVNSSTGAHNVPDEPGKEPNSVVEDDGHNNRVDQGNTGQNKSAQEKGIDDSQSGTPSQNKNSRIQGTPPSDFTQSVAQAREKVNALKEQFDLLDQTPDAAYGREHLASELEAQMQQYERTDPKYSQLKNMANTIRQGGTVKRGAITQGIGANLPPYVINNAQGSGIDFEHVGDVAKEMRANDLETQLGKAQHELDRATQFQVTNENTLQFTASGDKVASVAPEGTHTAVTPGTVDAKTMNFYDPKTLPTEDIVNQKRVALEQAIASGDSEAIKTAQGDLADASSKRNLYNSMSKVPFGKAFAVGVLGLGAYATTAEASSDINKGDYTRAGIDVVEFLDQTGVTTMGKAVYDTDALLKHLNAQEYQDNINTVRSANHGNSGGFTLMSYGDTQYRGVPVSFTSAENGHLVVNGAETGVNYDQFMQQNTMRQDDQINFARTITKTDLNKEGAMNYITQATTPVELAQRFNVLNSTIETPSFTSQSGIGSLIRSPNNSTPNERDGRYSQAAERVVNAFQSGNR